MMTEGIYGLNLLFYINLLSGPSSLHPSSFIPSVLLISAGMSIVLVTMLASFSAICWPLV